MPTLKKVVCVAGTRPEVIKMAPVIRAFQSLNEVEPKFVWSGQHYDFGMSEIFFDELQLPEPDVRLDVRSGGHADQTARVMQGLSRIFKDDRPGIVLAEGDTNTVLAAGLASTKEHIPFGHVEAGLRSYDRMMPEEINRCVADVCADINFAPTPNSAINLLYEGISPNRIFITGNTIVDVVKSVVNQKSKKELVETHISSSNSKNILVTVHRPETVDSRVGLTDIVGALKSLKQNLQVIFPMHPRTKKRLVQFGLLAELSRCKNISVREPLGYVEFLNLLSMMNLVLTDSGGVQEEAMILHVPTVTLRYNTERPETVWYGQNVIAGVKKQSILKATDTLLRSGAEGKNYRSSYSNPSRDGYDSKIFASCPIGDGKSGKRIARIVVKWLQDAKMTSPKFLRTGSATHHMAGVGEQTNLGSSNEGGEQLITLVYDDLGRPLFPYPGIELKPGFSLRMFGPPNSLEIMDRKKGKKGHKGSGQVYH